MICRCGHDESLHAFGRNRNRERVRLSCTAADGFKFCKCEEFRPVENQIQGEDEMAKKTKAKSAAQKSKRSPSVRGEKLYEAFSSKIEAHAIGKKVADKEHKGHTPLVARVLLSFDKPVTASQVITAAKNSGYESDNVERCVRGDLAILVREGLVKATKIAKPATEKKAKAPSGAAPRKPRAAKKTAKPAASKPNGASQPDITDVDLPANEASAPF
jgi:hypothetical protein